MARKGSMGRRMSKRSGRRTRRRMSRKMSRKQSRRMSRKQSRKMTRKQSRKMRRGRKKVGGAGGAADGAAVVRSQNREELEQKLLELQTQLAQTLSYLTDAGLTGEIMDDQTNHLQASIFELLEKIKNLDVVDAVVVAQEQARAQEEAVAQELARGYLEDPVATAPSELAVAEAASSRVADEERSQIEAAEAASRAAAEERSQIEAAEAASLVASSAEAAQRLQMEEVLAASERDQGMAANPEARRRTKMKKEERFT